MAMELPTDLINRLREATRAEAELSDDVFVTNDSHLPPLPSLSEVVAAFDPSPPYLSCKNCHGRLPRGIESLLCIYCGRATDFDHPPISFKDSIAYRWLLESLDLDGSELVTPSMDRSEFNLVPTTSKEEIPLSDLLDLKIQWPDYGSSDKETEKRTCMNFTGVDLDNFFSKSDLEHLSSTPEEISLTVTHKNPEATESRVDLLPEHKVNLFESIQTSESVIPLSGWEADFQPGGAIDQAVPLDHSEYHQEPSEVNFTFDSVASPSSGDWISDDLWANMNSTIPQQTLQSNENFPAKNSSTSDIISNLATGPTLFQVDSFSFDDPFTPTDSRSNNDDDWNDFTSSTGGPNHQSSPFLREMSNSDILSFLQVGPVSTSSSIQIMDRVVDSGNEVTDNRTGGQPSVTERDDESQSNGKNNDVELLISKMHDLSFMLGDELSLPMKSDRF